MLEFGSSYRPGKSCTRGRSAITVSWKQAQRWGAYAAPGRYTQVVWYRLILDYQQDAPGTYTLPITYSIVAN